MDRAEVDSQGDQIGQIFAQWGIVYFGQWFENYRRSAHFWATFFHGTSCVLILTKNGLGDFFTKSSGHPVDSLSPRFSKPFKTSSEQDVEA
jgi:hypothetical protein